MFLIHATPCLASRSAKLAVSLAGAVRTEWPTDRFCLCADLLELKLGVTSWSVSDRPHTERWTHRRGAVPGGEAGGDQDGWQVSEDQTSEAGGETRQVSAMTCRFLLSLSSYSNMLVFVPASVYLDIPTTCLIVYRLTSVFLRFLHVCSTSCLSGIKMNL